MQSSTTCIAWCYVWICPGLKQEKGTFSPSERGRVDPPRIGSGQTSPALVTTRSLTDGEKGGGRRVKDQSVFKRFVGGAPTVFTLGPLRPATRHRKVSVGRRRNGTSGRRCCRRAHVSDSATRSPSPPRAVASIHPPFCVTGRAAGRSRCCCVGASWPQHSR